MTTAVQLPASGTLSGRLAWFAAVAVLIGLTVWARSVEGHADTVHPHDGPATVEVVEGSEFARVTLSEQAAQRIGLEVHRVEPVTHPAGDVSVPYAALVYGPDGSAWVYATDGEPLSFRRQEITVATVDGDLAILAAGPEEGTEIAGLGSVQLYGTEYEVGH